MSVNHFFAVFEVTMAHRFEILVCVALLLVNGWIQANPILDSAPLSEAFNTMVKPEATEPSLAEQIPSVDGYMGGIVPMSYKVITKYRKSYRVPENELFMLPSKVGFLYPDLFYN